MLNPSYVICRRFAESSVVARKSCGKFSKFNFEGWIELRCVERLCRSDIESRKQLTREQACISKVHARRERVSERKGCYADDSQCRVLQLRFCDSVAMEVL